MTKLVISRSIPRMRLESISVMYLSSWQGWENLIFLVWIFMKFIFFSFISAPPESSTYLAYRCEVILSSGDSFMVNFKTTVFQNSFRKVHETNHFEI
jgi:hypothetical protein